MKNKLKILFVITMFFTDIINCSASTKTFDRESLPNYGVNKNWEITSSNKQKILNTPAVDASEKIYDYANVLTDEEEVILKDKIDSFISETKMDMVIVIPSFSYSTDSENEDYAANFYDYNDFGITDHKNSGVLFLRNANPADPYYNIYSFGDSQLYYDYDRLEKVLDSVYKDISNENYLSGFTRFINKMADYYHKGPSSNLEGYKVDKNGYLYKSYTIPWFEAIGASLLITIIVLVVLIKKNKMIMRASSATEYLDKQSFIINERKDKFITSHIHSYTLSSSDGEGGSSGGGFTSSSGSSGGGHSSGGGRHG